MKSLKERFDKPLPRWVKEIEAEAYQKISASEFAKDCFGGNPDAIAKQMLGLWPFVDEFPHMLDRGCWSLIFRIELMLQHGPFAVLRLLKKGRKILREIKLDEEDHRKLWLMTSQTLDLKYPQDFDAEALPAVKKWMEKVDSADNPFTMFVRFTAIEIIAECISKNLLGSPQFKTALGTQGCRWFKAHVHPDMHAGMTHEELALHLGFSFHKSEPDKKECNDIIQEVVDLFLAAADASRSIALPR